MLMPKLHRLFIPAAAIAVLGLALARQHAPMNSLTPTAQAATSTSTERERAIFGAGCFWGVEAAFRKIPGVTATRVGYAGGHTADPTYEKVCAHDTGHAEVVEIEFDPTRVSYGQLLDVFWKSHDPAQRHRLGPADGSQYRSAIFFLTPAQESAARDSATRLASPPNTEIAAIGAFHPAEEYHQQYYEKHGGGTCRVP